MSMGVKIGEKHIITFDEKIYNESINEQCKDVKVDRFETIIMPLFPKPKVSEIPKPKHKY